MLKSLIALTCLLALAYYAATPASAATCTYEILVKTGDRNNAGTDSRISLLVSGRTGPALDIPSLKAWGGQQSRNYFERGHLDTFRGTGPCITVTPCRMQLTSSGTGNKPGWYVSYVQVNLVRQLAPDTVLRRWNLEQWLAPPRPLSAVRNDCSFP
ncbi:hypothetical protein PR202_ga20507 [Eleusine coracana subsp. coracana]|uniref:PLAT domain-containing protein n=1 Tax=Eleusine coracana subsp. coracana TaxID=191504 RepID=A0AAV5CYX8_ELECO|nr:hypothetical protein PR202_ga20507 [Eleusine coracana subsp. coracana]